VLLNYALAALSGLLLVLVFPRFDIALLAPFVLTPLVYALAREWEPKHRFLLGWVAGIVFWGAANYWIHFVLTVHGGMGPVWGTVGYVAFVLARAVPMGIFALCAGVVVQQPYAVLAVPALWVAMERIPYLYDYKWLMLGNAGIDMGVPMRLAPFTGVYGLSFVFAMLGTAVAWVALRKPRKQLIWLVLVVAGPFLLPSLPAPERGREEAVAVQPNVQDHGHWSRPEVDQLHLDLELRSVTPGRKPALILWPEIPGPVYYFEDESVQQRVATLAKSTGTPVILGTVARTPEGKPLNSAVMVKPSGERGGRYDKITLVPFGEYVPWPFAAIVAKISTEAGDFEAGTKVVNFADGVGGFICYESAFPQQVRQNVALGAKVLVNLSNDGYFGGGAAREQHLSLVRMRAAENRRWVLRATNDGITASIDPAGRVMRVLPELRVTSGRLPFSYETNLTVYSRFGDWFAWLCVALSVILLVLSQFPIYSRG